MEKFQEDRQQARKYVKAADHMLTQTYLLLKDPKLFVAVIDDLSVACECSMSAVLHYDRVFKKIPPFHDNFESKFNMFKMKSAPMNSLNEYVLLINELKSMSDKHKESAVEFPRKDSFIIAEDNFKLQTITKESAKSLVDRTKKFIAAMEQITAKDEDIFEKNIQ
jgi:hypothetical protein